MKSFILIITLIAAMGCKRTLTHEEVEAELKKAMTENLYKGINYDSAKAKYDVQSVSYYEDKTFFECEFKVRVTNPGHDTTGIMTARISKDFSKVVRKS